MNLIDLEESAANILCLSYYTVKDLKLYVILYFSSNVKEWNEIQLTVMNRRNNGRRDLCVEAKANTLRQGNC